MWPERVENAPLDPSASGHLRKPPLPHVTSWSPPAGRAPAGPFLAGQCEWPLWTEQHALQVEPSGRERWQCPSATQVSPERCQQLVDLGSQSIIQDKGRKPLVLGRELASEMEEAWLLRKTRNEIRGRLLLCLSFSKSHSSGKKKKKKKKFKAGQKNHKGASRRLILVRNFWKEMGINRQKNLAKQKNLKPLQGTGHWEPHPSDPTPVRLLASLLQPLAPWFGSEEAMGAVFWSGHSAQQRQSGSVPEPGSQESPCTAIPNPCWCVVGLMAGVEELMPRKSANAAGQGFLAPPQRWLLQGRED